ncbi:MAG: LacI family DNA-binding transcriptional regulator [Hyphomicrobiales bacterium]|nr:LacI family DNA-binding transcriptional regulator [Hyphomicrobiales bacterium]
MSAATVSRALSAPHKVRPETRRRVMETVRRLDYTPNERARALRTGTARMVLVAVPNLHSGAFFPAVVNAIDAELSGNGYTMIIGSPNGAEEKARRLVDLVYARQIDGVIIRANCAVRLMADPSCERACRLSRFQRSSRSQAPDCADRRQSVRHCADATSYRSRSSQAALRQRPAKPL